MPSRPLISIHDAALAVVRRLREHGHQALWAGGCVRDMLLGREPKDIDVATDAPPQRIVSLFRRTRQVGAQFGVVMVGQGRHWIETATFRTDADYTDGRRPDSVRFTDAEHDAQRRDFTINGLFFDPLDEQVIDYVDGQTDLRAGVVRAIGDPAKRFAEDHLRMLRAVRFTHRLGFSLDPETAAAIRTHADKITRISPERIREELEKMFVHPARAGAVAMLNELGLLEYVLPGTSKPPEQFHAAVSIMAALPATAGFLVAMAALLNDRSPHEAAGLARSLRCSNQQVHHIRWLIAHQDAPSQAESLSLAAFKKLVAHPLIEELLTLYEAACTARGEDGQALAALRRRWSQIAPDQLTPPPFITGEDLLALGLSPGPRFKTILSSLYEAQLNEEITTREQALSRLQQPGSANTSGPL